MTEKNWGFYSYSQIGKEKAFVVFTGEHRTHSIYTIDFLRPGEATYHAYRSMLDLDISSYIQPSEINLTPSMLEIKLKNMDPGKSLEIDFRKFLQEKSN